jgi:hypothetical protein
MRDNPEVEEWLSGEPDALYAIARELFSMIRACGDDVVELLHDGCPTACVGGAAFAYVNVFKSHVNLGFYAGASLRDPARLLEGSGKRMRHVKIVPAREVDRPSLKELISQSYEDVLWRIKCNGVRVAKRR